MHEYDRLFMADPLVIVADLLAPAFASVAGVDGDVDPVVRPSERADAQANGALALAKQLGRTPRDVANDVVAAADVTGKATLEVAGPGFINVTFDESFLKEQLDALSGDERLGVRSATLTERVVVDYSAPNIAKEMHIGHLRTTVIGDALVRILEFVGHTVIRENHVGDWGTPFGMLIEHLLDIGETDAVAGLSVGDLDGFYKQARAKFDASEVFQQRARDRVVMLQSGDPETLRLWKLLVDLSMRHFNELYRKIGVLLTDDDLAGESMYNDLLPEVVERLRTAGLLQHSDGADVVFPPGYTNREGDPLPLIVQKRGGGFNYGTSDLACVLDRVERVKATLLLYVVGAPQAQHLSMIFDVAAMAGWLRPPTRAVHVAFGNVLGTDRKMLKSRSGEPVRFVDVVDEAIERATASVLEKNPDLPDAERAEIGRMVGVGALKFADLSTDRVKDYVFDWDRMLAFEGNTAPYLQYAHARIRSILRRAAETVPQASSADAPLVVQERELVLQLLQFDAAVQDTLDKFSPHRLSNYLFELAQAFTAFYEACPVLKSEGATRLLRLQLCEQTARVLAKGLDLLGIEAPERM
ncbi:MAG: arginyl-tRNA synthetase [Ilumatobacteraceae bacterium]|nr:arginyl-tRNA synthetase [Ilumatobacteraceae bacterium]